MTTQQAIDQVRMILDEVGIEYYSNDEVLQAIEQAQIEKALEYRNLGRKDLIAPLYRRKDVTGTGLNGIALSVFSTEAPLGFEACLCRLRSTDPALTAWAQYVTPEAWSFYRFSNGALSNRSPVLRYTYFGGKLYHNGAGTQCEVAFYAIPMLPNDLTQLQVKEPHAAIVDLAAKTLQGKEIIPKQVSEQLGAPERSGIGGLSDIFEATMRKNEKPKDDSQ